MYIEINSHEPSDIENDVSNGCRFDRLEVVGFPTPAIYMLPESS
jgi:hypothetical protein